jgi:ribonuclease P protein component
VTHSIEPSPPATLAPTLDLSFPKSARLRTKTEFDRVYARRCKASDGTLLVFAQRNELSLPRIGLSVSRKLGGAVVRNRLKRLLREAFRLSQHELPTGVDLVVIPSAAERANLEAYRESLRRLSKKLARRLLDDAAKRPSP